MFDKYNVLHLPVVDDQNALPESSPQTTSSACCAAGLNPVHLESLVRHK